MTTWSHNASLNNASQGPREWLWTISAGLKEYYTTNTTVLPPPNHSVQDSLAPYTLLVLMVYTRVLSEKQVHKMRRAIVHRVPKRIR
jgi:hypothetical protein